MKHNIKTINIFLTPAITEYVERRIDHLDKFVNPDIRQSVMCYVDLGKTTRHHKNGDFFKTIFTIHIGGKSFRAEAEENDLYASIDIATNQMTEEIKTFKDRKISLLKRSGKKLKNFVKGFYRKEE